jgi:hypothetical protein
MLPPAAAAASPPSSTTSSSIAVIIRAATPMMMIASRRRRRRRRGLRSSLQSDHRHPQPCDHRHPQPFDHRTPQQITTQIQAPTIPTSFTPSSSTPPESSNRSDRFLPSTGPPESISDQEKWIGSRSRRSDSVESPDLQLIMRWGIMIHPASRKLACRFWELINPASCSSRHGFSIVAIHHSSLCNFSLCAIIIIIIICSSIRSISIQSHDHSLPPVLIN